MSIGTREGQEPRHRSWCWRLALTRLLTLCLIAAAAPFAIAQGTQRARVSAVLNQSAVAPGQDAVVAVVMDIAKGFHAQSHKPNDPNLIALTITPAKESPV